MGRVIRLVIIFSLAVQAQSLAAKLEPATLAAFEDYTARVKQEVQKELSAGRFLWIDQEPGRREAVKSGSVFVGRMGGDKSLKVKGGLIHDWIGAVFVSEKLKDVINLLQDYDNHKNIYPEVIDSKLLSRDGNRLRGYLRLRKKKIITVVLSTEHDVTYHEIDDKHWYSTSYSTRISEVRDVGKPTEYELPGGEGHGFLWRLFVIWRFEETDAGVFAECRAISLTRGIPFALSWIIRPLVESLPEESLIGTLKATRTALENKKAKTGASAP